MTVGRIVDRHDEVIGREPVLGHDLTRRVQGCRGDDDVGVGDCFLSAAGHVHRPDAGCFLGIVCEALGTIRMSIEQSQVNARQGMAEHRQVAVTLLSGSDQGRSRRTSLEGRCESADGDARDRGRALSGDRTRIQDRSRHAGGRVVEHDQPVQRR